MLNKISFFQLDNLINNRVPFMFFNMSEDLIPWYTSLNKMHLENYQILLKEASAVIVTLKEKNSPKDQAIVLLCNDGTQSLKLWVELQEMAYTNVYVIDGGYQQMVTERK